jgi:exodeoxyribonuclease V beta subunit
VVGRPGVLRELPLDRHSVIEASAGTGKTFALEHLVIELLLSTDATLDQLLLVTFTEKATNELRGRIRAKLEQFETGSAAQATDEELRSGSTWSLDEAARAKLSRAVRGFDSATITTIHAFCQRLLQKNAFLSGRLFNEEQVDGRDSFGRAFRDVLRRDIANDPSRAIWLEAALRDGWSIVRIEELLWRCTSARGDLRPRFDPSQLAETLRAMPCVDMGDRSLVDALKSRGVHSRSASTVANAVFELAELAAGARETGDLAQFVLRAPGAGLDKLLERLPAALGPSRDRGPLATRADAEGGVLEAAMALALATPPFAAALANAILPVLTATLDRGKREAGRYDFDDMLELVDVALRGPRGEILAASLRHRFRYVLIDEFQDTDETQWSIFRRAFFAPTRSPARTPESVLVLVGDPKQSIYRFRGADVNTYLAARDEVVGSGGRRVALDCNYRATASLVQATNLVFDPRAAEPLFRGAIQATPVSCGRPDRRLLDGDGRPVAPLHVLRVPGEWSLEAIGSAIARQIRVALDPARPWRMGDPLEFHDVYVLTRTAREGRRIGAVLREAGIPHSFFKEDGLFQTDEAKDLRALLAAIVHPDDRARRLSAWLTPFFGVSLAMLDATRELPAGHPLMARLEAWKELADARDFNRLFESIVRDSGVLRRQIFFSDGERELTNYLHLIEILLERTREGHVTLADLLGELSGLIAETRQPVAFEGDVQRLETERRAVQIMTIHKAKGLEAPVVFVAGGTTRPVQDEIRVYHDGDGHRRVWVGSMSADVKATVKEEEDGEDQRLMYVAFTRAMGRLVMPCLVDDGWEARKLAGPYNRMNRRLADLLAQGLLDATVEDVGPPKVAPSPAGSRTPCDWQPPIDLVRDDDAAPLHDRLRAKLAGTSMTSYTRMKSGGAFSPGAWVEATPTNEAAPPPGTRGAAPADTLRSTRTSGVFLHELLERVDLRSFDPGGGVDAWRVRADIRSLFDEAMAAYGIGPEPRAHAEQLVWNAYATPLVLADGRRLASLSSAARIAREMRFAYPASDGPAHGGGVDARVFVRGSLDLAFEMDGLTYFVDWKSDALASYAPSALERRVLDAYGDQFKLYLLATAKLLGVKSEDDYDRRFGGILYLFLRGLDAEGSGCWAVRPAFADVARWTDELRSWSSEKAE